MLELERKKKEAQEAAEAAKKALAVERKPCRRSDLGVSVLWEMKGRPPFWGSPKNRHTRISSSTEHKNHPVSLGLESGYPCNPSIPDFTQATRQVVWIGFGFEALALVDKRETPGTSKPANDRAENLQTTNQG